MEQKNRVSHGNQNGKQNVQTTAYVAVLSAVFVVLALLSVGTNNFKASFESLVIVIAGSVLGPLPGFLVGIVGEFIYQMVYYGVDVTTPLWLLPYALEGLFVGLLAGRKNEVSKSKLILTVLFGELLLTLLVTLVNWASAVIQGWGNWALITAGIPLRLGITAVRIVLYSLLMPLLYTRLRRIAKRG